MNYFDAITAQLDDAHPGNDPQLIRYYALLVLTTGVNTTLKHVHDAWMAFKVGAGWAYGPKDNDAKINPYMVPFEEITPEIAAYDEPFRDTIIRIAGGL